MSHGNLDRTSVLCEESAQDRVLRVKAACEYDSGNFELQVMSSHHYKPASGPLLHNGYTSVARPA